SRRRNGSRPNGSRERRISDHHASSWKDFMTLFAIAKRAAVAGIVSVALVQAADAAASCAGAARHLVTLVRDNWPSSNGEPAVAIGDMLSVIRHKAPSGFIPGTMRFKLAAYSQQDFVKQA